MRGRVFGKHTKPPLVFMPVPPSLKTIGLFEWEVSTLKKKAKELSLSIRMKPDTIVWDQNSKKALVLLWNLEHDDCPFLSNDNCCRIYEDRPLVCQSYPLVAVGILGPVERKKEDFIVRSFEIGGGDCPNLVKLHLFEGKHFFSTAAPLWNTLFQAYGDVFLGALRYDGARLLLSEALKEAKDQKIINPARMDKNVIKAILRGKPIGLFEFLHTKGVMSKEEFQKRVTSIYDFKMSDLKKMINVR